MTISDRLRALSPEQLAALRAVDEREQTAVALENLEAEHLAVQEAYLRRKDRLLGHEVPELYAEIESARALLGQAIRARQARFEALRLEILRRGRPPGFRLPAQLDLLG